jgi:2-dehydropantoate 2-reductase
MMLEMQALGKRLGLELQMQPEERMAVTRRLGNFKTSMLQDSLAGRALETGPILGALVEIAEVLNHPVPFIRAVHGLMRVRAGAQGS